MPRKNGKTSLIAAMILGLPEVVDSSGKIKRIKSVKKENKELYKEDKTLSE